MKISIGFVLVLAAVVLGPPRLLAQAGPTLLATTDLDCKWKLDGKPQGVLKADDSVTVRVSLGKHLIQATSIDGVDEWKVVVAITQVGQEIVQISLKYAHDQRLVAAEWAEHPTWTDPNTGLNWARQDNGSAVNWHQASSYCTNLRLAGASNWRLPTIEELAAIYVSSGVGFKSGMHTNDFYWSNSRGNASDEAWLFEQNNGRISIGLNVEQPFHRALCVRG